MLPEPVVRFMPELFESFYGKKIHVMVRFGQWQESLDQAGSIESNSPEKLNDENKTSFHFSRSVAYAKLGQLDLAQSEFEKLMDSKQAELSADKKLIEDIYQHVAKAIYRGLDCNTSRGYAITRYCYHITPM